MNGIIGLNISLVMSALHCLAYERKKGWIIVQTGSAAVGVCRRSRYCAGIIELDLRSLFASPSTAAPAIQKACDDSGIKFLIPTDMPATLFLAEIKSLLEGIETFPIPSQDQLQSLSNKLRFARLLTNLDLPQPKYWEINSADQLAAPPWAFPVVLKPLALESSQGVKVCGSVSETISHFGNLEKLGKAPYQAQEYIPGSDLDLSIFADQGKVIGWTMHKAWRPCKGPMIYEFVEHAQFLQAGTELVKKLGYSGLIHIDGRLDNRDGSVKMVEANPRIFASMHYSALAGVNFLGAAIDLRENRPSLRKQDSGVLHSPLGSLYVLLHPGMGIPVNTKGTRRAWLHFLRDPLPVAMGFFDRKRARTEFESVRANLEVPVLEKT